VAELLARPHEAVHRYLLRRELFLPAERRGLHPLPPESDPHAGLPRDFLRELRDEAADRDPVNQVSRLELTGYMSHMLLRDSDVFSMANGIELRVPLLDHELVAAVVRQPGRWKRPDPRPKPLLIDAAGPRLPGFVHRLPKKGFTLPWDEWLRGPLRCRAERAVRHRDAWAGLGFSPDAPARLWDRFEAGDARVSPLGILTFVVLEDFVTRHGLSAECGSS
jgi:asparagine synthase (glutamine-hydrolysing)